VRRIILVLVFASPLLAGEEVPFLMESDFGEESRWALPYLERCHAELVRMMDRRDVAPPRGIRVALVRDPNLGGIAGAAGPGGLRFTSNVWPEERIRRWILAHELTNLFAARYADGGGYPSDWWSDGRSPFPEYVACLLMKKLGYAEDAEWRRGVHAGKPDHELFWRLHESHGFEIFARFFALLREDGVHLGRIGEPWPGADEVRTAYAIAYLSRSAGTNLAPLFREHAIGREPPDWRQRLPRFPFAPYVVTEEEVEAILAVREHLFSGRRRGKGLEILRELFRRGRTWVPSEDPPAASPVEFTVSTEFGEESAWTRSFLEAAAGVLNEALEIPPGALPGTIPVSLRKDPDLGGVAVGATRTSLDFASNCWPKERFRLWFLTQELAKLVSARLGGNLPEDWWGHGGRPFAAYTSSLVLRRMGHVAEADWVRAMHRARPDHELLWQFHERHGAGWAPRLFRMLREDGIDFGRLGGEGPESRRIRSLYLVAYLTLAVGENLAEACSAAGVGGKPADWDRRNPGVPFRDYRVTPEEVERLTGLRERLFGKGREDSPSLRAERERYRRGEVVR
jgi:hypothetical protein